LMRAVSMAETKVVVKVAVKVVMMAAPWAG